MAGSEVVAWYKQSVGFGWQALIRNQASASNPIPQTDCYLSPPFNSCKLHLLSAGGRMRGGAGRMRMGICGSSAVYVCIHLWIHARVCMEVGVCVHSPPAPAFCFSGQSEEDTFLGLSPLMVCPPQAKIEQARPGLRLPMKIQYFSSVNVVPPFSRV